MTDSRLSKFQNESLFRSWVKANPGLLVDMHNSTKCLGALWARHCGYERPHFGVHTWVDDAGDIQLTPDWLYPILHHPVLIRDYKGTTSTMLLSYDQKYSIKIT